MRRDAALIVASYHPLLLLSHGQAVAGAEGGAVDERQLRLSLSPGRERKQSRLRNSVRSPGSSLTCRPPAESEGGTFWDKMQAPLAESSGLDQKKVDVLAAGIRVVVTADYSGEIKVFLGLGEASLS